MEWVLPVWTVISLLFGGVLTTARWSAGRRKYPGSIEVFFWCSGISGVAWMAAVYWGGK